MVVGTTGYDGYAGYVFTKPGSGWGRMNETAKLTASDGAAYDYFGNSVSISGNTVVVGAIYATVGDNSGQGAAYVFTKPGSVWASMTQTAKLAVSDGAAGDCFGTSVSISGNTLVVGPPYATIGDNSQQGVAYVFGTSSPNDDFISGVDVNEAAAPRNGILESNETLKIAWTASSQYSIVSQTVTVDGKNITPINGLNGGRYSCTIGTYKIGDHQYTITLTDSKGGTSSSTGTFTVVAPVPPVIANPIASEAAAPKNGIFEANEKLKLAWTATSQHGIASQTVKVDGKKITVTITGHYSCVIGPFSVGDHKFTIRSTDTKGAVPPARARLPWWRRFHRPSRIRRSPRQLIRRTAYMNRTKN